MLNEKYRIWVAFLIFCAPYGVNLGVSSLWDINEAFYAETPREMLEAGDFITPRFNYQFRFQKPILSYWVVMASYSLLGISEFSERLPMAVGMMAAILLTYHLGKVLFNQTAGLFSALVLATSFRLFWIARRSVIDVLLLLFITLAFCLIVKALSDPKRRRLYIVLFFAAMGLGTLTKGLIALLIPGGVLAVYLVLTRSVRLFRARDLFLGLLVCMVIAAPWFVAMYVRHGWPYLHFFFGGQQVSRYLYGTYSLARPFWYYIPVFFAGFFPWSFFLVPAFFYLYKQPSSVTGKPQLATLFLTVWVVFTFLFFSFSRGKQEEYLNIVYPACALIVGPYLASLTENKAPYRSSLYCGGLVALVLVLGTLFYFEISTKLFGFTSRPALFPTLVMALASVWLLGILFARKSALIAPSLLFTSLALLFVAVTVVLPDYEVYKPVKPFALRLQEMAPLKSASVGTYKISLPSLCYYTRRSIFEVSSYQDLAKILTSEQRVFCIMKEGDFDALAEEVRSQLWVVDRRMIFSTTWRAFRALMRDGTLNHLVLVSNRQ